jgi:hypothetical protein
VSQLPDFGPDRVGFDETGAFVVVRTDGADIYARRISATGASAGPEVQVNVSHGGAQLYPAVSVFPDGRFFVAWFSERGGSWAILGQGLAPDGSRIGGETVVSETLPLRQPLDLASNNDGLLAVVWSGIDRVSETSRAVFRLYRW